MKKLLQLSVLALVVMGIGACGKMGELETVKADQVVLSPVANSTQAIDQAAAPELDILPHNSK